MSRLRWRIGEKLFRFHFQDKKLNSHRGFSPRRLFSESLPYSSYQQMRLFWSRTKNFSAKEGADGSGYHLSSIAAPTSGGGIRWQNSFVFFFIESDLDFSSSRMCFFRWAFSLLAAKDRIFRYGGLTVTSTLRDPKRLINLRTCREKTLRTI